ncbi:hypothetical protein D2V93_15250 [Flagellimonas taeanensis]|jgi:uncharacterized integral membrane protein|uniref:Uncharacterized protein n=2 Tax=Flagellimonas TaxID=444459 RepID=A0A1M6XW13_9FLAO|nr:MULTISPECIES: hypothetical protein [Allomuricauda]RUA16136.1 MAG: hypothetical protein DSY83_06230 [Flavobacteriia bacterium]KAB5491008.1 hypothetical protein FOT42_006150 [Allomuricauda hadalis]MDC6383746.1 hypothetical protein [Muricauda sp. SK9]MEE1961759.1 hypothetical protein [Allomuricauda taeanensis]RIV48376.1 hypothetical protein D2V93_15250 [Allomuricauda taeanensis]
MNRTFSVILIILALGLIAYNVTLVDFEEPFQGDSTIALIGIMASLCAVVLLLIYITSKKVENKLKNRD